MALTVAAMVVMNVFTNVAALAGITFTREPLGEPRITKPLRTC
jgi:hypothetical protein